MRVLVCGSRDWDDDYVIETVLEGLQVQHPHFTLIEGGARGADTIARDWGCRFLAAHYHEHYPADWKAHGKAAGPIRNQQMLDEGNPEIVYAFKDGFDWQGLQALLDLDAIGGVGGTEDMVRRAKAAGVPTYVVSRA